MLAHAEQVAVGILEPGNAGAAWGIPNAECVLGHERIAFKHNAGVGERLHRGGRVGYLPAEHGVGSDGDLLRDGHAQGCAMSVEHQRKIIFGDEAEPQYIAIECFGAGGAGGGHKGHQLCGGKRVWHAEIVTNSFRPNPR